MTYRPILATTLLCALLAFACSKATHPERQGASVPNITNDQSAGTATGNELTDKPIDLAAQHNSDRVQSDFMNMRESYRQQMTANLTALDRKVTILEGKAKYSEGKTKNHLEMGLTQIRADRFAFMTDYKSLDTVTSANWDATKTRLDKAWTSLSNLVDRS
jgi:hypothetical protein